MIRTPSKRRGALPAASALSPIASVSRAQGRRAKARLAAGREARSGVKVSQLKLTDEGHDNESPSSGNSPTSSSSSLSTSTTNGRSSSMMSPSASQTKPRSRYSYTHSAATQENKHTTVSSHTSSLSYVEYPRSLSVSSSSTSSRLPATAPPPLSSLGDDEDDDDKPGANGDSIFSPAVWREEDENVPHAHTRNGRRISNASLPPSSLAASFTASSSSSPHHHRHHHQKDSSATTSSSSASVGVGIGVSFTTEEIDGIDVFQELTPEELDRLQRDEYAENEFHRQQAASIDREVLAELTAPPASASTSASSSSSSGGCCGSASPAKKLSSGKVASSRSPSPSMSPAKRRSPSSRSRSTPSYSAHYAAYHKVQTIAQTKSPSTAEIPGAATDGTGDLTHSLSPTRPIGSASSDVELKKETCPPRSIVVPMEDGHDRTSSEQSAAGDTPPPPPPRELTTSTTVVESHSATATTLTIYEREDLTGGGEESDCDELDESNMQLEDDECDPYIFIKRLPPLADEFRMRPCCLPTLDDPTRKTLVLDLDETLVHCSVEPIKNSEIEFPVLFNDVEYTVYVRKRPYFDEFLRQVTRWFEVVVFTASQRIYAEKLLDIVDAKTNFISHRVYREACVSVEGNLLKDLTILGRDLRRTVIVDNSPQAFGYQLDNGIPIESWFDDDNDRELLRLLPVLKQVRDADDVRHVVRDKFRLRELVDRL